MRRRKALRKVACLRRKLRGAREGGHCLIGGEAADHHHRLAVGRLKMQSLRASSRVRLDLVGLRQRREQRLRLADLGHFRGRREAL